MGSLSQPLHGEDDGSGAVVAGGGGKTGNAPDLKRDPGLGYTCGRRLPAAMNRLSVLLPVLFAAAVSTSALFAAGDPLAGAMRSRKTPGTTKITSDRLEFDYKDYVALFEGHVKIVDPQFTLTADQMLVFFANTNDVTRVDAVGHVTMQSQDRKATCGKAVYTRSNGAIVLTGDPVVSKGENVLRGQKITVWIGDSRVDVEGGVQLQGRPDRH